MSALCLLCAVPSRSSVFLPRPKDKDAHQASWQRCQRFTAPIPIFCACKSLQVDNKVIFFFTIQWLFLLEAKTLEILRRLLEKCSNWKNLTLRSQFPSNQLMAVSLPLHVEVV